MMENMAAYMEHLKDSNLVWQIQEYFGIRKIARIPTIRVTNSYNTSDNLPIPNGSDCSSSSGSNSSSSNGFAGSKNAETGTVHKRRHQHQKSLSNGYVSDQYLREGKSSESENGFGVVNVSSKTVTGGVGGGVTPVSSDSGVEETVTDSDSADTGGGGGGKTIRSLTRDDRFEITNKFWYYLFSFGTALGDETFYASFFPFWFWNIDGAVGRRVVMVWVMIMYIGQGLKDIICWPRPYCPPAVRLEKKWALEFGMPSTHAMVGLSVPFSVLYYTMYRYEYPVYVGIAGSCIWCVVVCFSRIYMGMHTVLDIVGGLLLAVGLLSVFLPMLDCLDNLQLTHPYAPFVVIGTILFLALMYPSGKRWTPARGDTTIILGVGAGCSFGSWLNFQLGIICGPPMPPPYQILWPTYEMVGLTLLRTCIGILIVVATRAFFKSVSYIIVCWVLRLDPKDVENKQKIAVELSCKFITYAVLGFNATYLAPVVFRYLKIERATMFTEV